jgi:hypothetical protein
MYKVYYYFSASPQVVYKEFATLKEATDFAIKQPIESVLEIKKYDNKTSNIQD